jgi:LuxR family quorum-sensing system transcriptional regulator CciR
LCSFASRDVGDFSIEDISVAEVIGGYAFDALRRLQGMPSVRTYPTLTRRQRECLALVARGKSDSVVAQILNLKPHTVTQHIEEARKRYSVATRAQLIVRALLHCELAFADILDHGSEQPLKPS